jgi:hypothetical protein
MKKFVLILLAVVVVAFVAIGIIAGDRNRINDQHLANIADLNKKVTDKEAEIAAANTNLADITAAKDATDKELAEHKNNLAGAIELADGLTKAGDDLKAELEKANGDLAALKTAAETKEKELTDALAKEKADGIDAIAKLEEEGKKKLEDAKAAADKALADAKAAAAADVEKAKEEGQKALEAIHAQIADATAIWDKIEKGTIDGIDKDIEAFMQKHPDSLLKFIVPKAAE